MNQANATLLYLYGIVVVLVSIYILTDDINTYARRLFRAFVLLLLFTCFVVLVDIDNKLVRPQQVIVVTPEATSAK